MESNARGALWLVAVFSLLAAGCGQGPSFVDRTSQSERERNDADIEVGGRGEADAGYTGMVDGEDDGGIDEGGGDDGFDDGGADEGDGTGAADAGDDGASGDGTGGDDAMADGGSADGSGDGMADGGNGDGGDDMADGGGDAGADDGIDIPDPTPEPTPEPVRIERSQSFPTEAQGDGAVNASLEDAYLSQELTLQRNYDDMTRDFTQIIRPTITDNYTQGNEGTPNTDNFIQNGTQPLDILVVVDNSGSMKEEQVNLSTKLGPLLTYVEDSDWQIGVVTTDTKDGCLIDVIRKNDADADTAFANAVKQGTNGSGNERGVLQAVNGLTCNNPSWLRDESTVAVLIVSDEDNCSNGNGCNGKNYGSKDYLLDYLTQVRTPGVDARVFGLFWHPGQDSNQCSTARNQANIYAELVNDTMGAWGSICDADYSMTLETISQNIATILKRKFSLQYAPDPGSLKVYIDNVQQASGFSVSGTEVIFDVAPADGALIDFEYTYGANPMYLTFSLSQPVLNEEITITFDGMEVADTEYSYDPLTNKVTFNEIPAERTAISFRYLKDVALINEFPIGTDFVADSLRVFINQVETTDYTVTGTNVSFPEPPAEGSLVTLAFTAVGDPILIYPFTVDGAAAQIERVTDAVTGNELVYFYVLGFISFLGNEFEEGRVLLVEYYNEDRAMTDVTLPAAPIDGTVTATAGGVVCDGQYIGVSGQTVTVQDCGFPPDENDIMVNYKYVMQQYTTFTVTDPVILNTMETLMWKVYLNDQEVQGYTLDESTYTVSFPGPLPVGSTVKIEVSFYEEM